MHAATPYLKNFDGMGQVLSKTVGPAWWLDKYIVQSFAYERRYEHPEQHIPDAIAVLSMACYIAAGNPGGGKDGYNNNYAIPVQG